MKIATLLTSSGTSPLTAAVATATDTLLKYVCYERVLRPAQLHRLAEHKYNRYGRSLLEPWFDPFWNAVVVRLPLWLAPNVITFIGLLANIASSLLLVWFSPDGRSAVPGWCLLLSAVGLFVYQTLDAIDGKQARRTGSSSPLGELFDHGCDSLSTVFVSIGSCVTLGYGHAPDYMFLQSFIAISLFYCAHWQAFVSGALCVGRFDVTEVQCVVIALYLATAAFGPNLWSWRLPLPLVSGYDRAPHETGASEEGAHVVQSDDDYRVLGNGGIELRYVLFYIAVVCSAVVFVRQFRVILWGGTGKNGSSVAGSSVLSPSIPYGLVIVPAYGIFKKSGSRLFEHNPTLYIIAFGIVAAKVTCRLIVAQMSRSRMDYTDYALVGPVCLFLNQYFNEALPEVYVLYFCTLIACIDMAAYIHRVCDEICQYLHVDLFRIAPPGSRSAHQHLQQQTQPQHQSASQTHGGHEHGSHSQQRHHHVQQPQVQHQPQLSSHHGRHHRHHHHRHQVQIHPESQGQAADGSRLSRAVINNHGDNGAVTSPSSFR